MSPGKLIEDKVLSEYKSISRSIVHEEIELFEKKISQITKAENIVENIISTEQAYYKLANTFIEYLKFYSFIN